MFFGGWGYTGAEGTFFGGVVGRELLIRYLMCLAKYKVSKEFGSFLRPAGTG